MFELLILIVAIVLFFTFRNRVRRLEQRLSTLEQRLAGAPVVSEATPAADVEAPEPTPATMAAEVPPVEAAAPVAAEEPAPSSPPPTVPPVPEVPGRSFEERFGTQWVVWVGGIALALGGIFLVRYSIEQGLLGPGVRVFLGALFAAALVAGGEWARRKENLSGVAGLPSAHIPSILTAAGTMVAYATVYASYALYDFLAPASAFILLGIVALTTLAAALLHGPALAGLGLIGAYAAPALVASDKPDYWALYIYLAIVTAAAFTLARVRMWRWLALAAIGFAFLWAQPGIGYIAVAALEAHAFHVIVSFALAAALIVSGFLYGPPATSGRIDEVSCAGLAAFLLAATMLVLPSGHDPIALGVFTVLVIATIAIAWRAESVVAVVPAAAVLTAVIFGQWAVSLTIEQLVAPSGVTAGAIPEPGRGGYGTHLTLGIGFAALFGIAGFLAQGRYTRAAYPIIWSASAVFAPVMILVALYYRIAGFDRSIPFAAAALLLAAIYALATEALSRRERRPGMASSEAIFATGAVAALALALTMSLEKGWLTIALALMVPGIAWITERRPLPALRWLAAALVALVVLRIGWEPRIVGRDVGTTPIFNWLLYGYGVPALSFWVAGYILRKRADDTPTRMVESGAILFTVLLVVLEIRHYIYSGDIYNMSAGLTEVATNVCAGLAMAIGLERLRARTGSIVHNVAAVVIAAGTLAIIVFGLGLLDNPWLWGGSVGGPIFNLILLGYGLPAILTAILAFIVRGKRPPFYSATAAVVAVGLALAYLTLQVTRFYHGPNLSIGATTDAEQYTYSAVWLTFGVLLLFAGIAVRSQPARIASAAVVAITVLKVFLIDMAELTGIYRSLSFIGLGLVLIGIGWLYQRLLFPPRAGTQTTTAAQAAPPPEAQQP